MYIIHLLIYYMNVEGGVWKGKSQVVYIACDAIMNVQTLNVMNLINSYYIIIVFQTLVQM